MNKSDSGNDRTGLTMNNVQVTVDSAVAVNNCAARTNSNDNILDESVAKKITSVIPRER